MGHNEKLRIQIFIQNSRTSPLFQQNESTAHTCTHTLPSFIQPFFNSPNQNQTALKFVEHVKELKTKVEPERPGQSPDLALSRTIFYLSSSPLPSFFNPFLSLLLIVHTIINVLQPNDTQ